ncbi:uncharacterized protein Nmlp_3930 [Natronomonas moolapensis 8.8.11]|uniref:Uncharacterized protein n=1 Tax=Natronomonas moolapensis (strain DSM 18674 / CECT 7526 / JCM 14361 / 8.8.11) TaxID=268739 RepID=M1Y650_NATM8|nr:hypothetical protein [Natronomonas moolapensis]CCQ38041.1 uncharacterized protein Nmlp_3930 [Natronomonas moolapensis 8.8.11]
MYDPDSMTFAQRITLCCLVDMADADRTPADAAEIKSEAKRLLEAADSQPVGSLSDADVIRALAGLADTDFVDEQRPEDRSPVGKGRPQYALDADSSRLREGLEADEELAGLSS